MPKHRLALVGIPLALGAAPVAGAQQAESARLSISALVGGTVSAGLTRDALGDGVHAGVAAELRTRLPWLAGRADLGFLRFGEQTQDAVVEGGQRVGEIRLRHWILSATASAVLRPQGLGWRVQPYAVVGGGVHRMTTRLAATGVELPAAAEHQSLTRPGVGAGVGIELPLGRVTTFVQARYERIGRFSEEGMRLVPISVGARF